MAAGAFLATVSTPSIAHDQPTFSPEGYTKNSEIIFKHTILAS